MNRSSFPILDIRPKRKLAGRAVGAALLASGFAAALMLVQNGPAALAGLLLLPACAPYSRRSLPAYAARVAQKER